MLELLTEDASSSSTGIPVGPFRGRDAIAEAYTAQPPDDEIVLLDRRARLRVGRASRPSAQASSTSRSATGGSPLIRVAYER